LAENSKVLPIEKHRKARVLTPPGLDSIEKIIRRENIGPA
jgi:hypothetical protein